MATKLRVTKSIEFKSENKKYISSPTTPPPDMATKLRVTKSIEFKSENKKYISSPTTPPPDMATKLRVTKSIEFKSENKKYISSPTTPPPDMATKLRVAKSIEFKNDNNKYIKQYHTRGPKRGLMIMFSYSEFQTGPEFRDIECDCQMLKELFSEFKFRVDHYSNLSKEKTLKVMRGLSLTGYECVFIVVSSHGYERKGKWGMEFSCSNGGLIPVYDVVDIFNNVNYPELGGVPKVFIFQMCRGSKSFSAHSDASDGSKSFSAHSDASDGLDGDGVEGKKRAGVARAERIASDVLIAHSTLPGFEHVRNYDAAGSLYMQALCEVFAAHAHECHVIDLFRLVDSALQSRCPTAATVFENWGFGNLYLHPGLVEDADGNPTEVQ